MPDFKTIEEVDEALEKEYQEMLKNDAKKEEVDKEATEDTLDVTDTLDSVEVIKDDEDADVEEEIEEEVEMVEEDVVEPKVNKKDYAFKRLREEKNAAETKTKEFNDMAISLGYKDGNALLEAHKTKKISDEAAKKGIDPEFYQEFNDVKEELAKTRKAKIEQEKQVKVDRFIGALDEVAKANSLTAPEKQDIINQLAKDGYTMDDVIAIKTPRKLIRGYLADRIVKSKVQEKIKIKKEKSNLQEDKIQSAIVKEEDWKDEIAKEMKAYAKENNLHAGD